MTDRSRPHLIPADATQLPDVLCGDCEHEKNTGSHPTGAWEAGEGDRGVVRFTIELPLDEDFAIVKCPYGHEHGVVRAGSERARSFDFG